MAPRSRRPRSGRPKTLRPARSRPPIVAVRAVRVNLTEDPHAHIVCRVCGRIQSIDLTELDRHFLEELGAHHPDGWSVDGIAYSLTGACRRCREGPAG